MNALCQASLHAIHMPQSPLDLYAPEGCTLEVILDGCWDLNVSYMTLVQISTGGQGFRSDLPNSTWYNNGLTG